MPARLISAPLDSEQIVALDPPLVQQVETLWQRRLRYFTGRVLSDVALTSEQDYRSGHQCRTGKLLSPGVVSGLVLSLDATATAPRLLLSAGQGITRSGEDVIVPAGSAIPLAGIHVYNPETDAIGAPPPSETTVSQNFGAWTAGTGAKPPAGVFVLQPIRYNISGNTTDGKSGVIDITEELLTSPDRDPHAYQYNDWQTIEGCRMVFYPWPTDVIPLPATDAITRNHLAAANFAQEAAFARDDAFPWEQAGVPLAAVTFDSTWKPILMDRSSVVRAGGFPRLAFDTSFDKLWQAPNPFLAEARIRQFLEQSLDNAVAPPALLSTSYQYLPPVGVLTPAAMDIAGFPAFKNQVFPTNYTITARPVFAAEVDSFVSESAVLARFDLSTASSLEVLVPVAESDFDPALLTQAEPSPEFSQQIDQDKANRLNALLHRLDLRKKANALLVPLAEEPVVLNVDVADNEQADMTATPAYTAPATDAFGTAAQADGSIASTDYIALQTAVAGNTTLFNATDIATLKTSVPAFLQDLKARIASANDLLDLGFLRSQTDIYRYRQIMLDNTTATRLATSPVLTQIAQGVSAPATTEQLDNYFIAAKQASTPVASPPPYKLAAPPLKGVVSSTFGKVGVRSPSIPILKAPISQPGTPPFRPLVAKPAIGIPSTVLHANIGMTPAAAPKILIPQAPIPRPVAPQAVAPHVVALQAVAPQAVLPQANAPVEVKGTNLIQEQSPLVGAQYDFRTTSIAERLAQSPSQEATFYTGQNRSDVTNNILGLKIAVDDLPLGTVNGKVATIGNARTDGTILTGISSPTIPQDADEAAVLSAGIQALEAHITLLRQVEGRVAQYNAFISQADQAVSNMQSDLGELDSALKGVEDTLSNARSAYLFSTALLADETARDNSINARRTAILQAVPFLVYRRPREVFPTVPEPTCPLIPEASEVVPPACLNSTLPVPPELRQMTGLLRHAPLNWFPSLSVALNSFERPDLIVGLAQEMQFAAAQTPALNSRTSITLDNGRYAGKIDFAYGNQTNALEYYRQARAAFPVASIQSIPISTQRSTLAGIVSLGDLIRSSIANQIAASIARETDRITSVSGCLYSFSSQVTPIIRLAWADFLYQPSDNVDLADLAVLPNWGSVPTDLRYQIQTLVSWLFAQVRGNISDALNFMSDVVRVAILLASHAPVSEIITGSSLDQAPLKLGIPIRVSLPSQRIFSNMPVAFHDGNGAVIAHGTVSDLSTTDAAVNVTSILDSKITTLPAGSTVHFVANQTWSNAVTHGGVERIKTLAK